MKILVPDYVDNMATSTQPSTPKPVASAISGQTRQLPNEAPLRIRCFQFRHLHLDLQLSFRFAKMGPQQSIRDFL